MTAPVISAGDLVAGEFYCTRAGNKVGPLVDSGNRFWPFRAGVMHYKKNGFSCPGVADFHRDDDDIVAPWPARSSLNQDGGKP